MVGVDGCRGGWLAAIIEHRRLGTTVYPDLATLDQAIGCRCATILIDMPIGLPHLHYPVRSCDQQARQRLGPRRSSVFSPPARAAIAEPDYARACQINQTITGRRFSRQAWNIVPKIRELDQWLARRPASHPMIAEAHPEVCFASLAGRAMAHPKRKPDGRAERRQLIESFAGRFGIDLRDHLDRKTPRNGYAPDDLLDAVIQACVASLGPSRWTILGEPSEIDETGLPMQMVAACSPIQDLDPPV